MLAGGIESMSRMPYLVDSVDARWGHKMGHFQFVDAMYRDGFQCPISNLIMGETAELLARHEWPALYDADRLRYNDVPVAATIYVDDVYVEREFAMETARLIKGLRPWITNEYEHNGLRADGERVLDRLLALVKGRA